VSVNYRETIHGLSTNLAMIAVDKQGVVAPIKNEAKDRLHGLDGNLFLLGTLHVEHAMLDAVFL